MSRAYTNPGHSVTNATNFHGSGVELVINTAVMIAKVGWNATNTIVGNV